MLQAKGKVNITILICVAFISLTSCFPSTDELEKEEADKIQAYLSENSTTDFDLKSSGLYYLEVIAGTGLAAATHDTAYVYYSVSILDGTILESNYGTDDTLIFPVNEGYLIAGFEEGLSYMKSGGNSIFLVPSKLGYGATGNYYGTIAGYTPLIFDVKLLRVKPGADSN
jgi:FKBP-type peptidyl-prolyl cis-trans isomerase